MATLEKLITLMLELSEVEIRQLSSYVSTRNPSRLGQSSQHYDRKTTKQYMVEHGWFPEPETDE